MVFTEIGMRALGAVELVLLDGLGGLFGAGVGVRVGHFGFAAVSDGEEDVVDAEKGGGGGDAEDVAIVWGDMVSEMLSRCLANVEEC